MNFLDNAVKTKLGVHIRWMIRRDMPECLFIEHAVETYPWCEEDFLRVLRQRNCIGMVAEHQDKIVGFMIYELHKKGLVVLNFAVHPQFSRMKVGAQMLDKLKGKLSLKCCTLIRFYLRETNLAGQLFLQSQGFVALETIREYYEDSNEDMYRMEFEIFNDYKEVENEYQWA